MLVSSLSNHWNRIASSISLLRDILQPLQLEHLGGACHAEEEASELRISSFFRISCDSIFPFVSMVIEALNTDDLLDCVDRCHDLNSFTGSISAGSYGSKFTSVSCLEDRSCIPMSGSRPIYPSAFQQLFRYCYIIPLSESDSLEYVIVITIYRDNAGKIWNLLAWAQVTKSVNGSLRWPSGRLRGRLRRRYVSTSIFISVIFDATILYSPCIIDVGWIVCFGGVIELAAHSLCSFYNFVAHFTLMSLISHCVILRFLNIMPSTFFTLLICPLSIASTVRMASVIILQACGKSWKKPLE